MKDFTLIFADELCPVYKIMALISISRFVVPNSPCTIFEQVYLLTARIYIQNTRRFSEILHFWYPHTSNKYNIRTRKKYTNKQVRYVFRTQRMCRW